MNLKELKSITFPEVKKFLKNYVESKPEYESKWKDFFESGAGTNLIDIAAATTAFLGFNSYMARKDSMLDYSALPSTVMTIASTLGYVYNRKAAPRIKVKFNSARNVAWDRFTPIGTIKGRNVCLAENSMIKYGSNTFELVVGDWVKVEKTVYETKDYYSFPVDGVVDNRFYDLYINDEHVNLTTVQEELNKTNVLIRSHKEGVYLIFGNGSQGRKIELASQIRFEYIVPADKFLDLNFNVDDLKLNIDAEITESKIIDQGSNPDSTDKMVALAPGYYGTQRNLISYSDYEYIGASYEGLVSCKARPHTDKCCTVDVFYLRQDEQKFTPTQLQEFEDYLEKHSMMGTAYFVYPPSPIDVEARLKIYLPDPKMKDTVEELIKSHLNFQCMKLGSNFTMASIASLDLPTGVRVYIDYPIQDKKGKEYQYFRIRNLEFEYVSNNTLSSVSQGIDINRGYREYEYEYDRRK
nr:MAG TPA: baseplate wedge protein [Caudoviricetes sp.]